MVQFKYLSSLAERVRAQKKARGHEGPTGKEVDAQVASTLTRKAGLAFLKDPAATAVEIPQALLDKMGQTTIRFFPPPSPSDTLLDGSAEGFVDPRTYGGTSFDLVGNGAHEPLNVIILARPALSTKALQTYLRSLDFDRECLGLHAGEPQKAYIDPRGWREQEFLYRMVYTPLDHVFGTCVESLLGGNHIRAWQQEGGAWFLATSREMNATKNHMIVPDGYNVGRDELVAKTKGVTSFMGSKFITKVEYVAGLMPQGMEGVNHDIAVDGLTVLLTVTDLSNQPKPERKNRLSLDAVWNRLRPVKA